MNIIDEFHCTYIMETYIKQEPLKIAFPGYTKHTFWGSSLVTYMFNISFIIMFVANCV